MHKLNEAYRSDQLLPASGLGIAIPKFSIYIVQKIMYKLFTNITWKFQVSQNRIKQLSKFIKVKPDQNPKVFR